VKPWEKGVEKWVSFFRQVRKERNIHWDTTFATLSQHRQKPISYVKDGILERRK